MNSKQNFLRHVCYVLLALVFSLSLVFISPGRVSAGGPFVVNSVNEDGDANPGDGICDTGTGVCTLRAAIQETNALTGADTITFDGDLMITLGSSLPAISDDLTIDGSGKNITISGNDLYRVMSIGSGKTVSIDQLSIVNGHVFGNGGGIYNVSGTLTVANSTFSGNFGEYGGAINNFQGTLTVTNSTFSGNSAYYDGGGIYSDQGTTTVSNSTFSDNHVNNYGGGIRDEDSSLTVTNSTFSANSGASGGGGIYKTLGTFSLVNTILANSTGGGLDCYSGVSLTLGLNNLIESNNGCGTPVSTADPKLAALMDNGGVTQTFSLLPDSPAIDAGDDATCAAVPVNNLDQRGVTRPFGLHCDIGSYELEKGSLTTQSVGAHDGWILESGESTNTGGTRDSTAATFYLGDGVADKQYRAVLSFNTTSLPDAAVITRVTLKIKRPATGFVTGNNNPFSWGLGLKVDVCTNFFGSIAGLQLTDFNYTNTTNCKLLVGAFGGTPVASWYSANILSTAFPRINRIGTTQFRLRFVKDDNEDGMADYLAFLSGNYATAAARPTLVIEYYVP